MCEITQESLTDITFGTIGVDPRPRVKDVGRRSIGYAMSKR